MKVKEMTIKCFAKQQEGVWVAICLDSCLAAQGESFAEAKTKLEEQIVFYVEEAFRDKEYDQQLLNRRTPLTSWIEYYFIKFVQTIANEIQPIRRERCAAHWLAHHPTGVAWQSVHASTSSAQTFCHASQLPYSEYNHS